MATPENKVKQKVLVWLKHNMPGVWTYAPPGGAFGRSGVPDRIAVWRGVFFAAEIKADRTRDLTALQAEQLKRIRRGGGIASALYGFEVDKLVRIREAIIARTVDWVDEE